MNKEQFIETGSKFIAETCANTTVYVYYSKERGFFRSARELRQREICHIRLDSYCPARDANSRILLAKAVPYEIGSPKQRRQAYIDYIRNDLLRHGHTDQDILKHLASHGLSVRQIKSYIRAARRKKP